jgi:glycosyltransferase involved in cell wall biosynthesis
MASKIVYILGNPSSVFPVECAKYLKKNGFQVSILSRFSQKSEIDSIPIIATSLFEKKIFKLFLSGLQKILIKTEKIITNNFKTDQYINAMGPEKLWKPSFVHSIIWGLSISSYVKKHPPYFVYGHEVFSYGLATAFCKGIPKFIWPWGGDIYLCANTSFIANKIIKLSLKKANVITLTSISVEKYLINRFKVDPKSIYTLIWATGLDEIYKVKNNFSKKDLYREFGIPKGAKVIMNVRRFRELWGAGTAVNSFINLAIKHEDLYFVLIGGEGTEQTMEKAINLIREKGLSHRFIFNKGHVSMNQVAKLMCMSDIFVSLMNYDQGDMRSSSIIQASYAGSLPVLSNQSEYHEMVKLGYKAILVDPIDCNEVVLSCEKYLYDEELSEDTRNANFNFIEKYQNNDYNYSRFAQFAITFVDTHANKW